MRFINDLCAIAVHYRRGDWLVAVITYKRWIQCEKCARLSKERDVIGGEGSSTRVQNRECETMKKIRVK